mmetsp:Transcript_38886/g.93720  ORF Transcript_38886/g.93720 Transcript_38886/m.93720 type:complete len:81 (+) Transcript_38886:310-552(+)
MVYEVVVEGEGSGRCSKRWDDFEELYDSLELRYAEAVKDVPFPRYSTRLPLFPILPKRRSQTSLWIPISPPPRVAALPSR